MAETTAVMRMQVWRDYAPHALVVLATCGLFVLFKETGLMTGRRHYVHPALLGVLLIVLVPLRARDFAPSLVILHRFIVGLFTFYAVAAYPAVDPDWLARSLFAEVLVQHGRWVALAGGILAWWRPGLGLVPLLFVAWKKHALGDMFGFRLNATDYFIVAELGIFVILGMATIAVVRAIGWGQAARARAAWSLSETLFFTAMALHLANYFHSAVAKMVLDGAAPWTWVLENETHNIMMVSALVGLGPLQGFDWLSGLSHAVMHWLQWPLNLGTFALQLAAILGVFRLRWAVLLTIAYDVMHLGIFLSTGILFWKWMTLNVGLVVALGTLRGRAVPMPVMAIGAVLLLASPVGFRIAQLGWYDAPNLNLPLFEAILEDGSAVPIPTAFFLEGSAEIAKSAFADEFAGHFVPVQAFGKVKTLENLRRAEACALPVAQASGLALSFEDPRPAAFLRQHHSFILANLDEAGQYPYFWFPHHSWSNPRLYRDFSRIDLRKVVAYRYTIDSICFAYDGQGGIETHSQLKGTHVIELR